MYALPCQVNRDIVPHLKSFGNPLYPLKSVSLLRIDSSDGYKIEGKLRKNAIKFAIPKHLENTELSQIDRKNEFDKCLAAWISETVNIPVSIGENEEK